MINTGKELKMEMTTVAHWKNGLTDEEYLFWDYAEFMRQLDVGK